MDFFLNDLGQYFSVHSKDTIQDVSVIKQRVLWLNNFRLLVNTKLNNCLCFWSSQSLLCINRTHEYPRAVYKC